VAPVRAAVEVVALTAQRPVARVGRVPVTTAQENHHHDLVM